MRDSEGSARSGSVRTHLLSLITSGAERLSSPLDISARFDVELRRVIFFLL